jgi:hypothetical protein
LTREGCNLLVAIFSLSLSALYCVKLKNFAVIPVHAANNKSGHCRATNIRTNDRDVQEQAGHSVVVMSEYSYYDAVWEAWVELMHMPPISVHGAAKSCLKDLVLALLLDPDERDGKENTVLHATAQGCCLDVVKLLLGYKRKPNINARNKDNKTPLHYAAECSNMEIARLLLEYGADPHAKDKYGATPLHYAASASVAKLLIERGVDPNVVDNNGETPLHYAARSCRIDVMRALIEHGADINVKNNNGETPLDVAKRWRCDIVSLVSQG